MSKENKRDPIFESLDAALKLDASRALGFIQSGSTQLNEDESEALTILKETEGWAELITDNTTDRYDVRNFINERTCVPAGVSYRLSEKILRGLTEGTLTEADVTGKTGETLTEGMASPCDDEVDKMEQGGGVALDGAPPPVDPQGVGPTDADQGSSQNEPRGDKEEVADKGYMEENPFESIKKIEDPAKRLDAVFEMWDKLTEDDMDLPNQTKDPESGAPDYDKVEPAPGQSELDQGPADPTIGHDACLMNGEKPNDKVVRGQNESAEDQVSEGAEEEGGISHHLSNVDGDYVHAGDRTDQGLGVTEAIIEVARGVAKELNIEEDTEHWDRLLYKVAEQVLADLADE